MRVLIVHPYMSLPDGAKLVITKLANYLTKRGIENAVLTLDISSKTWEEIRGSEVILPKRPLRFPQRVPWSLTLPPVFLTLIRYIRKNYARFDVINVHDFPSELVALFCHKRVVWMCYEPPQLQFSTESTVERFLGKIVMAIDKLVVGRYVDCVCVADKSNADRFERMYGIKPTIIHYGIDYEFFSKGNRQKARETFNLNKDDFILLQVGMLVPHKNQLESIKVVENLKDKIPEIKLVLAGHGRNEYEQMLRRYVHDSGLKERVIFTGGLPQTAVRDLYAACDVGLYPVKPLGGWLSPFEALCAGKPIVVSTLMTAADMIEENKIGIVTDNLTQAVLTIYDNPSIYSKMAQRGGLWVKKNLSWDKFCENMVKVFTQS